MYAKDLPHSLTGCTVYIDEERKVNVYSHARATQCSHTSHIAPVLLAQDMVLESRSLQCEDRWVHLHLYVFGSFSPPVSMCRAVVSIRMVDEVLLVVVIRREEVLFLSNLELRDNLLAFRVKVLFLHLFGHLLCDIELRLVVRKDGRTVLCASIVALLVKLRGVMGSVEELDYLGI